MANQKEKRTFKDFKASIDEYFNKCEEDNILPYSLNSFST